MSFAVVAKVKSFKADTKKAIKISLKEGCEQMGYKHLLLINAPTLVHVDCMGTLVHVREICLKRKFEFDPPLLRAFIQDKEIICQMGTNAVLTMTCDPKNKSQPCKTPKKYCNELKDKFATELELIHISETNKFSNDMTCFFSQKDSEKIINDPINL